MDNLTHTLYGLALAKTGLNRLNPQATTTIILAANVPDIDLISLYWGNINYLKYHRGFTHSILGAVLEAAILASIVRWINNRLLKKKKLASWWRLSLLSFLGTGSHVLLDHTNNYGIKPFLPIDDGWYAWDIVFIVDPWILLTLILGLGLPFLFRLITQEIGATPTEYNRGAIVCLILIFVYWIAKDVSHRQALAELEQNSCCGGPPLRVGAMPKIFNPFGWNGIVETESSYYLTEAGWRVFQNHFETKKNRLYHKAEELEIIKAAARGPRAQVFLNFARFPLFRVDPTPQGYKIIIRDLRFEFSTRRRKGFVHTVEMDKHLTILSENFTFSYGW